MTMSKTQNILSAVANQSRHRRAWRWPLQALAKPPVHEGRAEPAPPETCGICLFACRRVDLRVDLGGFARASLLWVLGVVACPALLAAPTASAEVVAATEPIPVTTVADDAGVTGRLDALMDTLRTAGFDWDDHVVFERLADEFVRLLDPHGGLDTEAVAERRQRRRDGWMYGPGIQLTVTNGAVTIAAIRDDSPAADHELEVGDKVIEVDAHQVEKRGLYALTRALRADAPDPLTLVTRDTAGGTHTQRVERVAYQVPPIERAEILPFQLGYIQINRLRAEVGTTIAENIQAWTEDELYGVILDLRGADGEDLETVSTVASLFAEEGALLYAYRDRDDQDIVTARASKPISRSFPIMVLVDEATAGAAEVLAAVLRDSVRGAMLFGQPTAGDYLVHETLTLTDDVRVRLATRQLVTGDGTVYTGKSGLVPSVHTAVFDPKERQPVRSGRTEVLDEEIEQERLFYRIRGDASLRRAVDVLLGLKALGIGTR